MRSKQQAMDKPYLQHRKILLALVMVPILGIMGCILGFLVTGAATGGLFARWYSLGSPPERARRIVAANFYQVYVESENGLLFGFEAQNSLFSGQAPSGIWTPVTNPQDEEFSRCNYVAPLAPPAPANTIDFVQFGYCPEPIIDVRYAVLNDGSVMRWSTPSGIFVVVYAVPIGVVAGIVVGLLLTIIVWRRTKSSPSEVGEGTI